MEIEPVRLGEQVVAPPFDAILVHGYWLSEPEPGDVRLALRSRLAARAAAIIYDEGRASKVCVDLGNLWGAYYPSLGKLMTDELQAYGIPGEAIVLREDAYSTGGEVRSFVEQAKENGWTRIADVAFSSHHVTIPGIYKEYKNEAQVDFLSVEDIIKYKDNQHVANLVKRLGRSRYGLSYILYERAKWFVMHMPGFNYDSLEERNRTARKNKGREFRVPIDVYKL